jgi:CDP-4-dehydro-6-deoxyglucose reductase, E1
MRYPLATESWDDKEIQAACDVIKSMKCTMGEKCKQLEAQFADMFGSKYAIFSNSGSSANLLMMSALMYRNNGMRLEVGDEVIVPAVSWSTTYYPIHQNGLVCCFVDIDKDTLNIDVDKIEKAITSKTKAILAVNLLGNSNNFDKLTEICTKHNLILLEDNCESMGATYKGKYCGTIGLMGTFSTFFSHHINSIEGGITLTNDEELYQIMISLRAHGWTRGLPNKNFVHDKDGIAFNDLFRFVLPGYNLRPNEVFAALGLEQLKKLPKFLEDRTTNASCFIEKMNILKAKHPNMFRYQTITPDSTSSWFGFSIVLEGKLDGKREFVVDNLMSANIDCRPIVAGNFCKNPVIKHMQTRISGNVDCANDIDRNGLFIGNNQGDIKEQITYFAEVFEKILSNIS